MNLSSDSVVVQILNWGIWGGLELNMIAFCKGFHEKPGKCIFYILIQGGYKKY